MRDRRIPPLDGEPIQTIEEMFESLQKVVEEEQREKEKEKKKEKRK